MEWLLAACSEYNALCNLRKGWVGGKYLKVVIVSSGRKRWATTGTKGEKTVQTIFLVLEEESRQRTCVRDDKHPRNACVHAGTGSFVCVQYS